MKITNISKKIFNLESGVCKPDTKADATYAESKLLLSQGFAEMYIEPVAKSRPAVKPKGKN